MGRRVPGVERTGQNGVENQHGIARDLEVIAAATTAFGRYGGATPSETTVARSRPCGVSSHEVSPFDRWAVAELAPVLMEVERRLVLSSDETKTAGGWNRRLAASN